MNIRELVPAALVEVVLGVKTARLNGVNCLMPDVVVFEMYEGANKIVFEVPLVEERIPFDAMFKEDYAVATPSKPKTPSSN